MSLQRLRSLKKDVEMADGSERQVQWARLFLVDLVLSRISYGTGRARDLGLLMCQALEEGMGRMVHVVDQKLFGHIWST